MSKILVDTIDTRSGTSTLTLGSSNAGTIALGSGDVQSNMLYPAFHVFKDGDQSIATSTLTKINFANELFDTNNAYDNSTNYRFTVPSGYAGKYLIHMSGRYMTSSSFSAHLYLKINGGTIISACSWTNGYYTQNSNTIIIDLSVGDYLHVETWQNSGSNQNLNGTREYTFFQGLRIGT